MRIITEATGNPEEPELRSRELGGKRRENDGDFTHGSQKTLIRAL
jgi:hypothetical protein